MRNKRKKENVLKGVNQTLFKWAINCTYINEFLKDYQGANRLLADIFGDNEEKRENASIEFYRLVWGYYPELGPSPLVEVLAEFEHNRVFYENYRNHTTHIIKTFFLGMYFYSQVGFIRNAVNNILSTTGEKTSVFIKLWTITALYHDIGYVLENEKIENHKEEWNLFKNKYNEMLSCPLSCVFGKMGITREKERDFIKTNKIFTEKIESIGEIEAEDTRDTRIWKTLWSGGKDSCLTNDETVNGIHKYYEFAAKKRTVDGRQGFMDHGICSALLLEKMWYAYFDYLKAIIDNNYDIRSLSPLDRNKLIDLGTELNSVESLVHLAANAIALHNINKEIWNKNDAISYQIFLDDFRLKFTTLPLACLLRLCDEIQLWDRNRFRRPQITDKIIAGSDMELVALGDMIYLQFDYDDNFKDPKNFIGSEYNKLCKKLNLYLDEEELNKLLTCGKPKEVKELKERVNHVDRSEEFINGTEFYQNNAEEKRESEKEPWLVGAVNLDEDVHFSSFYLRQSMRKNLPEELKEFGYCNIVAVYEDFNEICYIPKKECIGASKRLIAHSLKNCNFWNELLLKIEEKIDILEEVFVNLPQRDSFRGLSDEQILNYYENHNAAHNDLYIYAGIPEVLDRGVPTFTMFLKNYLKRRSEELRNGEKLNRVFDTLTYPEMLGCSGENILEMCDVISFIKGTITEEEKKEWGTYNERFLIRMRPEMVHRIEEYMDKWIFWGYHGYRDRVLKDFNYFAEKLRLEISNEKLKVQKSILVQRQKQGLSEKIKMFEKYNIDEKYQNLFKVYSKIGTMKLKRCYSQLKNFNYLDQLLLEIAKRYQISESVVRCMFPDEIICLLRGDRDVLKKGMEREKAKLLIYRLTDDCEEVICGLEAEAEAKRMKNMTDCKGVENGELFGETASTGSYCGICRVMDGKSRNVFKRGEILTAKDIELDKFDLLKLAGAVVTETGGFTCCAAIVCRQLQIPCIVGVHGLTSYIHTGQRLDIDADKGRVKIMDSKISECICPSNFDETRITQSDIGSVAYSLMRLSRAGFSVPDFFCVCIDVLKMSTDYEQSMGSLIDDIKNLVRKMNYEWWVIRSSTNCKDDEKVSDTGKEIIVSCVYWEDIIQKLNQVVSLLKDHSDGGSIIIQKMVLGNYSGVVFTNNPIGSANELLIHAAPSGNEYFTCDQVKSVSYTYRKDLLQFDKSREGTWKNLLSERLKEKLREQAIQIAEFFDAPQDIEWTAQGDDIYFLQSKKIVKDYRTEQMSIFSSKNSMVVDTETIYQVYDLPNHLREHLLKTAAVVCWIMDHWRGCELNEEVMIKACLLHDIGNIVKGTAFISPNIQLEKSWQYWLSIRKPIIEKYGKTNIEVTLNIAKEINVSEDVLKLIEEMQFSHDEKIYSVADFAVKICAYADQRVSPQGILLLEGRLDEARFRQGASCIIQV